MSTLAVIVISFIIIALCIGGVGIKMFVKRNGEFKRLCSGRDPYSGKAAGCQCSELHTTSCSERQKHPYQPFDVNDNLLKETL